MDFSSFSLILIPLDGFVVVRGVSCVTILTCICRID